MNGGRTPTPSTPPSAGMSFGAHARRDAGALEQCAQLRGRSREGAPRILAFPIDVCIPTFRRKKGHARSTHTHTQNRVRGRGLEAFVLALCLISAFFSPSSLSLYIRAAAVVCTRFFLTRASFFFFPFSKLVCTSAGEIKKRTKRRRRREKQRGRGRGEEIRAADDRTQRRVDRDSRAARVRRKRRRRRDRHYMLFL